jgi:hypothetical protein
LNSLHAFIPLPQKGARGHRSWVSREGIKNLGALLIKRQDYENQGEEEDRSGQKGFGNILKIPRLPLFSLFPGKERRERL